MFHTSRALFQDSGNTVESTMTSNCQGHRVIRQVIVFVDVGDVTTVRVKNIIAVRTFQFKTPSPLSPLPPFFLSNIRKITVLN